MSVLLMGVDIIILHAGSSDSIKTFRLTIFSISFLDVKSFESFVPTCKIIYDGCFKMIGLQ